MDTLWMYLGFEFVQLALIVGVLISVSSSCLGVTLVLKRYSMIGDGLSHVAFGAMCVGAVFNVTNDLYVVMPITVLTAVLLLCVGNKAKNKGDSTIAMISVGTLAFGYLIVNRFSTSANVSGDVCSSLFGSTSILTLTQADMWICIVMSVVVALFFILCYNKIFAVTFDDNFMRASGSKTGLWNFAIAVITAIVISISMRLVGSLLITALIIFPALSAMRLFKSYKAVIIFSVCFGAVTSFLGIILSIVLETPVGSTIVVTDVISYLICYVVGQILNLRKDVLKEEKVKGEEIKC